MSINIHKVSTVYNGYFKLEEVTFSFPLYKGEQSQLVQRLIFERGDASAVLITIPATQEVVLVEQFRLPVYLRGKTGRLLELVAGIIEKGETPLSVVVREAREEAGIEIKKIEPIGEFFLSPGASTERCFLYLAEIEKENIISNGGGNPSENEDIKRVIISFDKALEMVEKGEIIDAKTVIALLWYQKQRRK